MTLSEFQQNTLRSSATSDFATDKSHFSWYRLYNEIVEGDQETHTLGFSLNLMIKCFYCDLEISLCRAKCYGPK